MLQSDGGFKVQSATSFVSLLRRKHYGGQEGTPEVPKSILENENENENEDEDEDEDEDENEFNRLFHRMEHRWMRRSRICDRYCCRRTRCGYGTRNGCDVGWCS